MGSLTALNPVERKGDELKQTSCVILIPILSSSCSWEGRTMILFHVAWQRFDFPSGILMCDES
jgi:hypothetical protein